LNLLVLGASARAAAFSAVRAGLVPSCGDLFADRDLAAVCPVHRVARRGYPAELARVAAAAAPGPWLYTGALENHPELVDRISRRRPLWGNGGATLRGVRDPLAVLGVLRRAGLPVPEARLDPAGLPRDGSWLVKPLASAGGLGIARLGPTAAPRRRPCYYQERIEGPSLSALFVGDRDGAHAALAGVTRQEIGRPRAPFAYVGSLGPWPVAPRVRELIEELGEVLAASFGLAGLFGIDFILRDGHPWPVEINPRYTASVEVLELALRQSFLARHRRVFDPSAPRADDPPARDLAADACPGLVVGKAIVFAPAPCRFPAAELASHSSPGRDPFSIPRLGDLPDPETRFETGEPVLTVFAAAAGADECHALLRRARSDWERRLRTGPDEAPPSRR
jgi:predicted ATP-grasp superfamily ATP-dependent carboligase